MSGGSFEYLCFDELEDLLRKGRDEDHGDLARMRDALIEYAADELAQETEDLRLELRSFRVRVEAKRRRLWKVWQAVEWHHSMDYGRDQVLEAIAEFRAVQPEPVS